MKKMSCIEAVKGLALKFNGAFKQGVDSGYFSFDNAYGKGHIRGTNIFLGLEVISFDVTLSKSIEFDYINLGEAYLHCIFIEEGYLKHSFQLSNEPQDASRFQNVIVGSRSEDHSRIKLPQSSKLKFLIITLENSDISGSYRGKLQVLLNDVVKSLSVEDAYSYFGDFSCKASPFVNAVINTEPNNLNSRLLIEAGVLNILSCQFLDHEHHSKRSKHDTSVLSKSEYVDVIKLSEFIANNLENPLKLTVLERESGLNQKRIQKGFQHFFGMSVNKYIMNLKILKAKELMEKTDLSISEIVYKIGLNSRSYFSRIFSSKYGLLPNEYRKNFNIYNPTFELSYYSEARDNLTKFDFEAILKWSRKRNSELHISGCLIYHNNHFFQILEGPKEEVLQIYKFICGDDRHSRVTKLYDGFKSGRTFDEWTMAFLEKPLLFNKACFSDFKMMNMELILEVNKSNPKDTSNRIRTKLMWERARNAVMVANDQQQFLEIVESK